MMFSQKYNRNVFIDFGLSEFIVEHLGTLQTRAFRGSYKYASDEMKKLVSLKEKGTIDLYFNDLTGLTLALKEMIFSQKLVVYEDCIFEIENYYLQVGMMDEGGEYEHNHSPNVELSICLVVAVFCLSRRANFNIKLIDSIMRKMGSSVLKERFYKELADLVGELWPKNYLF